jgi:hypothetical protein
MTPQLYKEIQDVLKETKSTNKYLVRALALVNQLIGIDAYVAKHVIAHLQSILK